MEDNILEILKNSDKALSVYELEDKLDINDADGLKELLKVLNNLEDELKVYRTNKNNYMLFNNSHLKIGTFLGNKKSLLQAKVILWAYRVQDWHLLILTLSV